MSHHPSDDMRNTLASKCFGDTTKRNLRLFFILDRSGSMGSDGRIEALNHAIKETLTLMVGVEKEMNAKVLISVIAFNDSAEWHIGPDPLPVAEANKTWQDLTAGGGTSFVAALRLLLPAITREKLGDRNLPPLMLFVSDGHSADQAEDYAQVIAELDATGFGGKKSVRLSIGIGAGPDEYGKDQLDAFVSPWLREQQNIETFPARRIEDIKHLIVKHTVIHSASKATAGEPQGPSVVQPPPRDGDGVPIGKKDETKPGEVWE